MNRPRPSGSASRLAFVDALRALAATLIAWHHFAVYGPLALAPNESTFWIDWLDHLDKVVPIFFVIAGYVSARTLSSRTWDCRQVARFAVQRYCRLGLPYLGALCLAMAACAYARDVVPDDVLGAPATWDQIVVHVFLIEDILGYESLSAGFWFVAIDYQLGLLYVAILYLRDAAVSAIARVDPRRVGWIPQATGWLLALAALFYFNLDESLDVWAIFFWGHFFMGILVYRALADAKAAPALWLYVAVVVASLAYDFRERIVVSLAAGLVLYLAGTLGRLERWPTNNVIARLGLTSYSLFLVHFPIIVIIRALWSQLGGSSLSSMIVATVLAYVVSLLVAEAFYRVVEAPCARASRRFS